MQPVTDEDVRAAWDDFWIDPERPHQAVPDPKPTDWLEGATWRALKRVLEKDRARCAELTTTGEPTR